MSRSNNSIARIRHNPFHVATLLDLLIKIHISLNSPYFHLALPRSPCSSLSDLLIGCERAQDRRDTFGALLLKDATIFRQTAEVEFGFLGEHCNAIKDL